MSARSDGIPLRVLGSIAAVAVLLWLLFARFAGMVLPLAVVVFTLFASVGTMGWLGLTSSSAIAVLPAFLVAVGVSSAVHVLSVAFLLLRRGTDRSEALVEAFRRTGVPLLLTGLTTAGATASFLSSDDSDVPAD